MLSNNIILSKIISNKLLLASSFNAFLGLVVQAIIVKFYMFGETADAYFIALAIPQWLSSVFNSSFNKYFTVGLLGNFEPREYLGNNLLVFFVFSLSISTFLYFSSTYWYHIFGTNKDALSFFKIMVWSLPMVIIYFIGSSYFHFLKNHELPEFISIFSSIIFIASFLLFTINKIYFSLPLAYFLKDLLLAIVVLFKLKSTIRINILTIPKSLEFGKMRNVFATNITLKSATVIDKYLLSGLPPGSFALVGYFEILFNSINRIMLRTREQKLIVEYFDKKLFQYRSIYIKLYKGILGAFVCAAAVYFIIEYSVLLYSDYKLNSLETSIFVFFLILSVSFSFELININAYYLANDKINIVLILSFISFIFSFLVKGVLVYFSFGILTFPFGFFLNYFLLSMSLIYLSKKII